MNKVESAISFMSNYRDNVMVLMYPLVGRC